MSKLLRGAVAGWGASKIGGGCFSTILIFFVIYWALGNCGKQSQPVKQGTNMQAPAGAAPAKAVVKL